MANLLTPEQKKYNARERMLRIVVVVLWFVFGTIIIAGVFLTPSYILIQSRKEFNDNQVALLNELIERREKSDVQAEVRIAKTHMSLLANVIDDNTVEEVLRSIISARGSFITVSDISYSYKPGAVTGVTLVGMATNRSELLSFTKRLERVPFFQTVELPTSNLVQSSDISFSLSIALSADTVEI